MSGPAPPVNPKAPKQPTMEELLDEIKKLKARNAKDPGEIIRPDQPKMWDGEAAELDGFFLQLELYFRFFPTKLKEDHDKVMYAGTRLGGAARRWFEAYLRDWFENDDPDDREQETMNILTSFDNFQIGLTDAFGKIDKERDIIQRLKTLVQKGSAAGYAAKFRELASHLDWDDQPLMAAFYDGLKEEVKDKIFEHDEPKNLTKYIELAVRIDNRLYERRQQKKNVRNGWNYVKKDQKANQGARRAPPPSTAHGSHSGPMELGAVEKRKCYNCGTPGHLANQCRKPKKQQDWKPVPDSKKQLGAAEKATIPTATKTLGMIRGETIQTGTIVQTFQIRPGPVFNQLLPEEEMKQKSIARQNKARYEAEFQNLKERYERYEKILKVGPLTACEYVFCYDNQILRHIEGNKKRYIEAKNHLLAEHEEVRAFYQHQRRHQNPNKDRTLTIYGRTTEEAMKAHTSHYRLPRYVQWAPMINHAKLSWASCYDVQCPMHWQEKVRYNTFPWPDGKIPEIYTKEQAQRFTIRKYQNEGFTVMVENLAEYPPECVIDGAPVEECLEYQCKIHADAKIEQWHEQKEAEEEAAEECGFDIKKCYNWNCPNHLENKQIALDEARSSDDDENVAKSHLKEVEKWEDELRQLEKQNQEKKGKTPEFRSNIKLPDPETLKEWDEGYDKLIQEKELIGEWMEDMQQKGISDPQQEDFEKWTLQRQEKESQERVNQAKNKYNHL